MTIYGRCVCIHGDAVSRGVNALHFHVVVCPVEAPEAMKPQGGGVLPSRYS